MFTRSEAETGIFFSMIPEYGVCGHFTICSLYPLERFGKMLFSCQVSAETGRHEPTWARLMVLGLRHEQQRSDLDVMQCIRLPVERPLLGHASRRGGMHQTRSSRAVRCESLALAGLLTRNTSWRNGSRTWATAQLFLILSSPCPLLSW